jgi:mono/diheme cytochrome c family protein
VDCHARPGQVVFEGYVKGFMAEPERVSGNCVRCHPAIGQRNDQRGFKFNTRAINITHQQHLERGATCISCHANVAHDLETPRTNRPTMENCYACHSRSDSCAKCHSNGLPPAKPAREAVGRRPVASPRVASGGSGASEEGKALFAQQCASCHGPDGGALPTADLRSREYLESKGAEGLARATAEGKGGMPALGVAKGGTLTSEQIKAIVDFLLAPAAGDSAPAATEQGKALFAQQCASCHGPDGAGLPMANLKSRQFLEGRGAEGLARATAEGKGGMPAYGIAGGGPLSDEQVKAIVQYLLSVAN